jgi:hypothetical protein
VQIWSGYLAQTAPGWALLARGTANQEKTQPYEDHEELWVSPPSENYEGIIETDSWFGPLSRAAVCVGIAHLVVVALFATVCDPQLYGWGVLARALPEFTLGVFAYRRYCARAFAGARERRAPVEPIG